MVEIIDSAKLSVDGKYRHKDTPREAILDSIGRTKVLIIEINEGITYVNDIVIIVHSPCEATIFEVYREITMLKIILYEVL